MQKPGERCLDEFGRDGVFRADFPPVLDLASIVKRLRLRSDDWPITEQKPLFSLFGGAEEQVGVTLTPGGLMRPLKSRSGILFPDDAGFVSCLLCTQKNCPGRRAPCNADSVKACLG